MYAKRIAVLVLLAAVVGCGNKKNADDPSEKSGGDGTKLNDTAVEEPPDELPFDEEQSQVVLKRGARKAEQCPASSGAPAGEGDIEAVFDGPKGRIVDVKLGFTWNSISDQAQECIKNAFIGEIIPPFTGTKTVPFTIKLTEAPKAPKK